MDCDPARLTATIWLASKFFLAAESVSFMSRTIGMAAVLLAVSGAVLSYAQQRPAPPPSRYTYSLVVDLESLPKGVKIRESDDDLTPRLFISNSSDKPLIIDERSQNEMLVAGTKLAGGKVYHYFPSGVPMEGKTHLKGWQAPFGDIPETLLRLPRDPPTIAAGREKGLGRDLPKPEPFSIPANYDGKPHAIEGEIRYQLNNAYDEFYAK
jgi:hypothetical protein